MKLQSCCLRIASLCRRPADDHRTANRAAHRKGAPFKLTIVGHGSRRRPQHSLYSAGAPSQRSAPEKPGMENRYATFLVEPTAEWNVGVYPIRVKARQRNLEHPAVHRRRVS